MSLPPVNPPIRILIRTRLAQLQKIHHSIDQADTELIKKLCDKLSINDEREISHLITRISDVKKLDDQKLDDEKLVDIVFDYGIPTIRCQPSVIAYAIEVKGPDLIVTQLSEPYIRGFVNRTVDTYDEINFENNRCFPIRPDIRAETQRQRRAMLPVSNLRF
jgi:hypothetical protein